MLEVPVGILYVVPGTVCGQHLRCVMALLDMRTKYPSRPLRLGTQYRTERTSLSFSLWLALKLKTQTHYIFSVFGDSPVHTRAYIVF